MALIRDINERRGGFRTVAAQQLMAQPAHDRAPFTIEFSGVEGLERLTEEYVNRGLLLRVNQHIVDDIQAGRSDWPERFQFSRFHFRANDVGIANAADYAEHVENLHAINSRRGYAAPSTYSPEPIKTFVVNNWVNFASEDIRAQIRRSERGG